MATLVPAPVDHRGEFARDVRSGLSRSGQKEIPSKYLYDDLGSALFEAICLLPEYGLTRADERLLRRHAQEIVRRVPKPAIVSELGSGSGRKTRPLLEAFCPSQRVSYYPIEISPAALAMIERELSGVPCLTVVGLENEYLAGLAEVAARRRPGQHLFVLFLGSTIGNFDTGADIQFLSKVRGLLLPGDSLLLGADLVKPLPQLLEAYDDPAGVTAAFNLNLLARVNRELGAGFDLRAFRHHARFNQRTSSIEMHLRSLARQTVRFPDFQVNFAPGETIWTESSHKYCLPEIARLASSASFILDTQWIDDEWPFTENLLLAA